MKQSVFIKEAASLAIALGYTGDDLGVIQEACEQLGRGVPIVNKSGETTPLIATVEAAADALLQRE